MDIGAADIDRWHRAKGWFGIGYHFVIRRRGKLEMGRPVERRGAHARGHNRNSIGVCLIGGVDEENEKPEDNFTNHQLIVLEATVRLLLQQYPGAAVLGHRDIPGVAKACPSFDVAEWASRVGVLK